MNPTVSVLMPVHNGIRFLDEAIRSIISQTLANWEFVIINDGSTDGTHELLNALAKEHHRLRIVHQEQKGRAEALNRGLSLAEGDFIARMDADDRAWPTRLEKQTNYLRKYPDVAVVGSRVRCMGVKISEGAAFPSEDLQIRMSMLFFCPIAHPTVMLRAKFLRSNRLQYPTSYPNAEDYAFWMRFPVEARFANLPDILMDYRIHPGQSTMQYSSAFQKESSALRQTLLSKLGLSPTADQQRIHEQACCTIRVDTLQELEAVHNWLLYLEVVNNSSNLFPSKDFRSLLADRWLRVSGVSSHLGTRAYGIHKTSRLSKYCKTTRLAEMKLLLKCLLKRSYWNFR